MPSGWFQHCAIACCVSLQALLAGLWFTCDNGDDGDEWGTGLDDATFPANWAVPALQAKLHFVSIACFLPAGSSFFFEDDDDDDDGDGDEYYDDDDDEWETDSDEEGMPGGAVPRGGSSYYRREEERMFKKAGQYRRAQEVRGETIFVNRHI